MRMKSGVEFQVVVYEDRHFEDVKALWREAFPDLTGWRAPDVAIPAKIATQRELFLVAVSGGRAVGTTMAGYDGHRGWLYTVAVLRSFQREGIGSALIREAETRLAALGCPKINLQIIAENASTAAFYERLGYAIEARVSMGKPIGAYASEGAP